MLLRSIINASIIIATSTSLSFAQELCRTIGEGTELNFGIKPSLVAHSDAILDTTFGSADMDGGEQDERLFSFTRTIGALLESAGAQNDPAHRQALVQTMLTSFSDSDESALNPAAGILLPMDGWAGEANKLTAEALLDESHESGLRPLAVFNRFDLAPADWIHCGEHRIVYGKNNPDFESRFLLIFEAAMPNPAANGLDRAAREQGCRPVAEFWAKLSSAYGDDDMEIAQRLSAFFYEGKTDPSLEEPDLPLPVMHFRNLGGDGSRGQVRGNLFMEQPWQLREWLTQLTFEPDNPLAFVVETVKYNPIAELYQDDLGGTVLAEANLPAALTNLHGEFIASLTSEIRGNLMAEETQKHRDLVTGLDAYDLGTGPDVLVEEETILFNTIALGNDDKFNEHQSTSQGSDDALDSVVGTTLATVLKHAAAMPSQHINTQTAEILLNRAQSVTCGGCHMLANPMINPSEADQGIVVRNDPNGAQVTWPAPAAGGFVHVTEDRVLSPALEEKFLPVRRYILGRHLCPVPSPTAAVAALDADVLPGTDPAIVRPAEAMSFVDEIIAGYLGDEPPEAPATAVALDARAAETLASQAGSTLDSLALEALRQRVHDQISEARRLERNTPGAFVEQRRPH